MQNLLPTWLESKTLFNMALPCIASGVGYLVSQGDPGQSLATLFFSSVFFTMTTEMSSIETRNRYFAGAIAQLAFGALGVSLSPQHFGLSQFLIATTSSLAFQILFKEFQSFCTRRGEEQEHFNLLRESLISAKLQQLLEVSEAGECRNQNRMRDVPSELVDEAQNWFDANAANLDHDGLMQQLNQLLIVHNEGEE